MAEPSTIICRTCQPVCSFSGTETELEGSGESWAPKIAAGNATAMAKIRRAGVMRMKDGVDT
jgi:hypothetical protein